MWRAGDAFGLYAELPVLGREPCICSETIESLWLCFLNEVAHEKNRKTAGMAVSRNTDTLYITGHAAAGDDRAYLCDAQ